MAFFPLNLTGQKKLRFEVCNFVTSSQIIFTITLHWFAGFVSESDSNSFLLVPLIVVAVIAGVLIIVAVILMIIVIKQCADNKGSYIYCFESNNIGLSTCCLMDVFGPTLMFLWA